MKNLFKALKVTSHTDYIQKGSTFVALSGFNSSGLSFIPLALEKGATKIVVQSDEQVTEEISALIKTFGANLKLVSNARVALAEMAAQAYGLPANKLKIIGVTGTKGKTTSVFLLHHIFNSLGFKTALISGVHNVIDNQIYACNLTTPQADYLQAFFGKCVEQGIEYVFMEASAHAFTLHRLHGVNFSGGIFTNLDLEHLEFYKDMDEYFYAKVKILGHMQDRAPFIVNIDNPWGKKFFENRPGLTSFGLSKDSADYSVSNISLMEKGQSFVIRNDKANVVISTNLIGKFNAYNVGAVTALANRLGLSLDKVSKAIKAFEFVPGRMEKIELSNGALAVIDYAHNPLSYNSVLPELKKICKELIVVFGAGGERDISRRPLMGQAASKWANKVIVTSDNPRSEDAAEIAKQICSGMQSNFLSNVTLELDREKAISLAYKISSKDSLIAIFGKGPDNYQIIGSKKFYFSDKETILKQASFFQRP